MLATNKYPATYLKERKRDVAAQLDSFEALAASGRAGSEAGKKAYGDALAAVEAAFCANLIQALDHAFVHRTRGQEGKDGNALNEVRMLCASLQTADAVLMADKTIKYDPARAVSGIAPGEKISLRVAVTRRLVDAFLAGIEAKFS
ncbi:MAG: hypothetical protein IPP44_20575 [Ideonella sp.]|nr:hypothetical protein [Ideonella sp.]